MQNFSHAYIQGRTNVRTYVRTDVRTVTWLPDHHFHTDHTAPKFCLTFDFRLLPHYPTCDSPLKKSAQRSFAPSKKSRRHNRSCMWTEALSGIISVSAQKLCSSVNTVFISPGYYSRPKRNRRKWLCKNLGVNKVHYGVQCENGHGESIGSHFP